MITNLELYFYVKPAITESEDTWQPCCVDFLGVLPGTYLCCCHGSTPPPQSGYGTE